MRRDLSLLLACLFVAVAHAGCRRGGPESEPEPPPSLAPAQPRDAIGRLVTRLSAQDDWGNGGYSHMDLPATATPEDVVAEVFRRVSWTGGRVTRHTIRATRRVQIPGGGAGLSFTAVEMDTDLGAKVVLLQYLGSRGGWWTRSFDPG